MKPILLLSKIILCATITLNLSDKDKQIRVNVNDIVKVSLNSVDNAKDETKWEWTLPTASNSEVLETQQNIGNLRESGIDAVFKVVGQGESTINSFERCKSNVPKLACPRIVIPWSVTITT